MPVPPTNLKARTALAADIAKVNRQRFNEAVAEGFYPCAPATARGATRIFDVNDIVTLRIYGRLLDEGMIPRAAGNQACGLRTLLQEFPELERAIHVTTSIGSPVWLRPDDFNSAPSHLNGIDIVSVREWILTNVRAMVIHILQEEAATLGPSDDRE